MAKTQAQKGDATEAVSACAQQSERADEIRACVVDQLAKELQYSKGRWGRPN